MSYTPISVTQQIDYTSVDQASIKQNMLNRIPQLTPEWTDTSESDMGVVIIELWAGIGDMLKQYEDRIMNEGFIDTAQTVSSMKSLCALIGYSLSNASAAIAYLIFKGQLDPVVQPQIRVPQGTQASLQASDNSFVYYETNADTYVTLPVNTTIASIINSLQYSVNDITGINAGSQFYLGGLNGSLVTVQSLVVDTKQITLIAPPPAAVNVGDQFASPAGSYFSPQVLAYEGQTHYQEILGYSNGYPNLAFSLSFPNVLDDNSNGNFAPSGDPNQITLLVDEGAGQSFWTETLDFSTSGPNDNVYVTRVDEYGYSTVYFGDGKNGRIPVNGSQVAATYRAGGGSRGNIGQGSILLLTSAIQGIVSALAASAGSGGADAETLDHARSAAPASLATLKRGVTANDIATLTAQADNSIIAAQVTVEDWNTVNVAILTNSMSVASPSLPPAVATNVANYVAPRMMVTQTLTLSAVTLVLVYLSGNLYISAGSSQAAVLANVTSAITTFFALGRLSLGQNIYLSVIEALIMGVSGVDHVDLTNLSESSSGSTIGDITIAPGTVAVLIPSALNLTAFGGF
jgi:uncharacterized phage protein gp47/JayE